MTCKPLITIAALTAIAGTLAFTQPAKDKPAKPAGQPAGQPALPPGMTPEDMQACMAAATPGEQHTWLAQHVGHWKGTSKMWMAPDTEPTVSQCTTVITAFMDGRFFKNDTTGDMPGMGPFTGFGVVGFDNVTGKFQSTWCDSMGTGMMTGTGDRSSDGSTLTINYTVNCPTSKGPQAMRQVEKWNGKDTMTLEMYGPAMHTNKEYKCMEITYTRSSGSVR